MFGKIKSAVRSNKQNQKLGINVPSIVNKFMTSGSDGFIEKTEYNYFWEAMKDNAPDVDVYIHLLVQYLLNYMSKKDNNHIPFNAQVLLNTINFLVLRHPTNQPSKQVKEILSRWIKNRNRYNDQILPAAKDVLGVLYKQRVEQKSGLDSLIIQCYQFYSHDELSRISDYYQNPTIIHVVDGIDNIGRSSGDKVCIWPYLKDLASCNADNFRLVIQITINKLMSISGTILLLPKLAEISLLALIFMMRQLISYSRVPDQQFLDRCISNLKKFYLWPVPYGSQARDLLLKLQNERVAPGYALIQKVWRECRLPEIVIDEDDMALAQQPITNKPVLDDQNSYTKSATMSTVMITEDNSFRPLYYLFDVNDEKSLLFANIMKIDAQQNWGSNYKVHSGPSAYISAVLILNIIGYDCGHSNELDNAIKKLNEHEIMLFYKQVIDIFLSSSDVTNTNHNDKNNEENKNESKIASQSRVLGLKEIRSQIIAHASEKDDDDDDECVIFNEDIQELKSKGYRVELPTLHHTGIGCDLKKIEFPSSGQMASNEMMYPSNEVLVKLTSLLKNLHSLASEQDQVTLRFMISGGNSILNGVATAYASLVRHAPTLLANFNIEFFVLPYSKNHYSEWLARQDPWYNRHIYLPLQCKLFVAPSLLPDTKSKKKDHGHLHTVGDFYREMSENYAREADQLVKLRLWECLCWENPPYTKTPHQLIPFCQRVEIGEYAEHQGQILVYQMGGNIQSAQHIHVNSPLNDESNGYADDDDDANNNTLDNTLNDNNEHYAPLNASLQPEMSASSKQPTIRTMRNYDMMDDDNKYDDDAQAFDYQPIPLDIEWQPVDMLGRAQIQSINQKSQIIDKMYIGSCPRYEDQGFPASPDKAGVIHMFSEIREITKKKKFQEYGLLKSEPSQHVRTCVITSANGRQHSVSREDKFFVMVDDKLYGKFTKIKIQPMIDPITKEHVHMPIRTFFPVNV